MKNQYKVRVKFDITKPIGRRYKIQYTFRPFWFTGWLDSYCPYEDALIYDEEDALKYASELYHRLEETYKVRLQNKLEQKEYIKRVGKKKLVLAEYP